MLNRRSRKKAMAGVEESDSEGPPPATRTEISNHQPHIDFSSSPICPLPKNQGLSVVLKGV